MTGRGPEGKVQDKILEKLRLIPDSDWTKATVTNKKGAQDIFGDILGTAIYIEVKRDEYEKPEPLQLHRISRAIKRGAISFSTFSWQDCHDKLRNALEVKGICVQLPSAGRRR